MGKIEYNNALYIGDTKYIGGKEVEHGRGTTTFYESKNVYTGYYHGGLFEGEGTMTFGSGGSFKGVFHAGKRAEGTSTFKNGDTLKAKYDSNQQIVGDATYTYKNGKKEVGPFRVKKGEDGVDKITESYGRYKIYEKDGFLKYDGYIENDIFIKGNYFYRNGNWYSGQFNSDNQKHGQGTLCFKGVGKLKGNFKNGSVDGYFEIDYSNGNHITGTAKNGLRHGLVSKIFYLDENKKYTLKLLIEYRKGSWKSAFAYINGELLEGELTSKINGNPYIQLLDKEINNFLSDKDNVYYKNYSLLVDRVDAIDWDYYPIGIKTCLYNRFKIMFTLFKYEENVEFDKNHKIIFDEKDLDKAIKCKLLSEALVQEEDSLMSLMGGEEETNDFLTQFKDVDVIPFNRKNGEDQNVIFKMKNIGITNRLHKSDTDARILDKNYDPEKVIDSVGLKMKRVFPFNAYEVKGMGSCRDVKVVVPSYIGKSKVKSIGKKAFYAESITSVDFEFPLHIKALAFSKCFNMKAIYLRTKFLEPEPEYNAFLNLVNLEKIVYCNTKHIFELFFAKHYWLRNMNSKKEVVIECTDGNILLSDFLKEHKL